MSDAALPPPIVHQQRGPLPVLLSVPHSGRDYPDWLVDMARSGKRSLQALEDPLVDRLAWRAMAAGCGAVVARTPRAAIDCNRGEDEIDPSVIAGARGTGLSARARGGLGIVPARTLAHGFLWRRSVSAIQLEARLASAYRPYHEAVAAGLDTLRDRFGQALLLDCHSMPPPRKGGAQVVIGDAHGRASASWLAEQALAIVRDAGFSAALNDPFAGGHIIARHGQPGRHVHALQLEIDRSCYLDRALAAPGPGFDRVSVLIERLARDLGAALIEDSDSAAIAAE